VPNILGHLSFSLIGDLGQPKSSPTIHNILPVGREIYCAQTRNLSDNLLFSKLQFRFSGIHEFHFVLIARTANLQDDRLGQLNGWIFLFEKRPPKLDTIKKHGAKSFRRTRDALVRRSAYAVGFQLRRNGACVFGVPECMSDTRVSYDVDKELPIKDGLRYLTAQCFYFLRDITHKHFHHHPRSDAITTVWDGEDRIVWVRETLYELYKRALEARRIRSVAGQERAAGILAYAEAFESHVAGPLRALWRGRFGFLPQYDGKALGASLTSLMESKRRRRIQKNVVAAAIPALFISLAALANTARADLIKSAKLYTFSDWAGVFGSKPVSTLLYLIRYSDVFVISVLMIGVIFVLSLTETLSPPDYPAVKEITQLTSLRGKWTAVVTTGLIGIALASFIVWALFLRG